MYQKPFFEKIVLGHNGFFGVDHLSSERGQQREAEFSDVQAILKTIRVCVDKGAGGMMMSTHARAAGVCDAIKKDPDLCERMRIYPLLPYAQKYVTAANEKGILSVLMDMLSGTTSAEKFKLFWNGAKGVLGKDIHGILASLIQVELQSFRGLRIPCVFLHDVFTDLALGLNLKSVFEFYYEEMDKNYNCKAAFATKNLPLLLSKFQQWGFDNPLVMPHVNAIGFSMNPSREAVEQVLQTTPAHVMAMSTLASGAIKPEEAYAYLGSLKTIESVVVGVTRIQHVDETFGAIQRYL
jgi:hypothetical protein